MLLSLFLVSKTIFLCLFLFFHIVFNKLLVTRSIRLILVLVMSISASIAVANEQRETPLVAPDFFDSIESGL